MELNLEYARKNEGLIYGEGAALLAEKVARAAAECVRARNQSKAVERILREFVEEIGGKPDIEVFWRNEGNHYRVGWEGGPYEWAIVASDALGQLGIFAEPHYSFDLCFYPSEDK